MYSATSIDMTIIVGGVGVGVDDGDDAFTENQLGLLTHCLDVITVQQTRPHCLWPRTDQPTSPIISPVNLDLQLYHKEIPKVAGICSQCASQH